MESNSDIVHQNMGSHFGKTWNNLDHEQRQYYEVLAAAYQEYCITGVMVKAPVVLTKI